MKLMTMTQVTVDGGARGSELCPAPIRRGLIDA